MSAERPQVMLGAPATRRFLNDFVKRRVGQSDVDDVVQTVLVDALSAARIPEEESELRRWLTGIARHKIADLHRKAGREQPSELGEIETAPAPVEERMMAEWAEEKAHHQTKDAERTLRWMAREGEGEKLEQIAAEEQIEAATVRQRVSRMRRWMKEQWIAELAAACAIVALGFFVWRWLRTEPLPVGPEPKGPQERAFEMRREALDACKRSEFQPCLDGLDRAKEIDPNGDGSDEVKQARERAAKALEEEKQAPQLNQKNGPPTKGDPKGNEPEPTDEKMENLEAPSSFPKTAPSSQAPTPKSGPPSDGKKLDVPKGTPSTPAPAPTTPTAPNSQKTSKSSPSKPGPNFGTKESPSNESFDSNDFAQQQAPQPQLPPPQPQDHVNPPPQQQQMPTKKGSK